MGLCKGCSTKKAVSLPQRSPEENHQNTMYVYFQFHNPKLTQERCFIGIPEKWDPGPGAPKYLS